MSPSARFRSVFRFTALACTTLGVSASAQTYAFPGNSVRDILEGKVHRSGKERAGAIVSGLAATATAVGTRFILTAVRLTTGSGGGGDLRLIAWEMNLR
ncbi:MULTISPECIES: hypothetical protein [Corallococcus]|uniref:hypothetical protein n=1 Tax=Corallococcus TaxID=83461 RepID=UPI0018F35D7A|nr:MULTISPECIES: hypothetical protein [Corallococcus]